MAVFDLFSKRQKVLRGEIIDVYTYDKIPKNLRVQIIHIVNDAFGEDSYGTYLAENLFKLAHDIFCREYGVFQLHHDSNTNRDAVFNFLLSTDDYEIVLDTIEVLFRIINKVIAEDYNYKHKVKQKITPEAAVVELNERFQEHGIGYKFEANQIIRIDSELVHTDIIKPTLSLLSRADFSGANQEFLSAHEHYRHGKNKECLVDCLKAFESTMKTICTIKKWRIDANATASALIKACMDNELLPASMQTQFSSLRSLLESGVPTIRNKNGGHGQGVIPVDVPQYLAKYALNLTASNILFLVDSMDNASK